MAENFRIKTNPTTLWNRDFSKISVTFGGWMAQQLQKHLNEFLKSLNREKKEDKYLATH